MTVTYFQTDNPKAKDAADPFPLPRISVDDLPAGHDML